MISSHFGLYRKGGNVLASGINYTSGGAHFPDAAGLEKRNKEKNTYIYI